MPYTRGGAAQLPPERTLSATVALTAEPRAVITAWTLTPRLLLTRAQRLSDRRTRTLVVSPPRIR